MGMVKYSIIGLIIMLPFFIQSTIQNTQYKYKERQRAWIEQSIEEASYDAGFALKTYSTYAYDSQQAYNIQIPHREVIRNFFDSLKYRGFRFSLEDFPLIAFVEYDGIVLYNPQEDELSQKNFYTVSNPNNCEYYTLSEEMMVFSYETGRYERRSVSPDQRNSKVTQSIELALNTYQGKYHQQQNVRFVLPEFEGSSSELVFDDVGVIIFYDPEGYAYLDGLESYKIVPSGIMKMDLPIDL